MAKTQLPDGVTLSQLDSNYRVAAVEYRRAQQKAAKLDATDKGRLWEAIGAKYPPYQILPDKNDVSYVKNNIFASLYTVGKSARLVPTSDNDKDIVENINIALEHIWDQLDVSWYQLQAGERAALLNLGITQVGWDNSIINPDTTVFSKGECKLKNIDALKFMRDPFAEDIASAQYCMTWDYFHKDVILSNDLYKETFQAHLDTHISNASTSEATVTAIRDKDTSVPANKKDYYKVITHWVRVGKDVHEIHTLDNHYVLAVRESIKPAVFPFAELYCNLPSGDLFGTSEPAKIFASSVAYNIMLSTILTAEYKNQRPPRFISKESMLNIASFTKHGNDADKAFVVSGDASRAVHYHQFPQPTQTSIIAMGMLSANIQQVTGVDGKYTGRDTGSILTTGGIEGMLDQVTMIDAPKVENYEHYSKRLTQLILSNYIEHSALARKYFTKDKRNNTWKSVTVDFPNIDTDTVFSYTIAISSELPKNKGRIEAMANKLMNMQMQYQGMGVDVDLIQPEEWLQFMDIPMKEYMLERMNIQRTSNWTEVVAQVVNEYSQLVQQGVQPDQAMMATAESLRAQNTPNGAENFEQGITGIQQLGGAGNAQQF